MFFAIWCELSETTVLTNANQNNICVLCPGLVMHKSISLSSTQKLSGVNDKKIPAKLRNLDGASKYNLFQT